MSLQHLAAVSAHNLHAVGLLRPFPTNPATVDIDAACEDLATGYNREAAKWGLGLASDSCLRAALLTRTQRYNLTEKAPA